LRWVQNKAQSSQGFRRQGYGFGFRIPRRYDGHSVQIRQVLVSAVVRAAFEGSRFVIAGFGLVISGFGFRVTRFIVNSFGARGPLWLWSRVVTGVGRIDYKNHDDLRFAVSI